MEKAQIEALIEKHRPHTPKSPDEVNTMDTGKNANIEASHGRANYQSSNGMYQYQYYTHDQQTEQYSPPCSLCSGYNHSPKHCYKGEHDINNIIEKMSIDPHQQQQGNLY